MENLKITEEYLKKLLEDLVNQIPRGKVTTYKILAEMLGDKIATKFVAMKLKEISGPTWRVIRSDGSITDFQKEKLKNEGVEIKNGKVDLQKHLFREFKIKDRPLIKLRKIQKDLVSKIILEDCFEKIDLIGGADISFKGEKAYVIIVVLDRNLKVVETVQNVLEVSFPYIPSFLAFREGPPVIETWKKLENNPDILFVNGHGIAHPVKLGLATYVGIKLDIPTIGNTKSILVGYEDGDKLIYNNEQVGWVLKNRSKTYVSPGHKVSLKGCYDISKMFWKGKKYVEPIYIADILSKRYRRGEADLYSFS